MFSPKKTELLKTCCASFRISLSEEMISKLQAYTDHILEWNKRINLVSKNDANVDRILRHIIDSLSIFKVIDVPEDAKVMDLGSGAGFPIIPMKIVREDFRPTLVESIHKKVLYLRKAADVLKFKDIDIMDSRIEDLSDSFFNKYDIVTAKAFGKLAAILDLSLPFLKIGGILVVYKGKGVEKELKNNLIFHSWQIHDTAKIEIPEIDITRSLVTAKKIR
jgi:16S rRNA (guanine527-N7)-methyltransferase